MIICIWMAQLYKIILLRNLDITVYEFHNTSTSPQPSDPLNRDLRTQSWAALEELNKGGILRSIGVSNYTLTHLTQLLKEASVVPHVNQVNVQH